MKIGQRIKERRKELGMSADELAEKIGKSRATVFRYENGDIENLPLDILAPLSKALNTTPDYLMSWDNVDMSLVSEITDDANNYEDAKESFLVELSESHLTPDNYERMINYAKNLTTKESVIKKFERIYEMGLSSEDLDELYNYALFIKSKREK